MSLEIQVTYDALDPIALARFWAEALGYVIQPPPGREIAPDEDPIEVWQTFLEAAGVPEDQRDTAAAIVPLTGSGPRVFFQKVPELKSAKNRVHLDLRAAPGLAGAERMAALETACAHLVAIGASRLLRHEPAAPMSHGFITMTDPEGN